MHASTEPRLPDWGPYTKRYAGISHIPQPQNGLRFDLSVFPGYYRGRTSVPNVRWESMHYPWEAAADLSYFTYRHELEWKDQVYADISYIRLTDHSRLIRCHLVNRTDAPQALTLHFMASLDLPPARPNSDEVIRPSEPILPAGVTWIDALSYDSLDFAHPRPTDNLVADAQFRGEVRDHGFVAGSGVGLGFGADEGDRLHFAFDLAEPIVDAALLIRYRVAGPAPVTFSLRGLVQASVELPVSEGFGQVQVHVGEVPAGPADLLLTSLGTGPVELDGFALGPAAAMEGVGFTTTEWHTHPTITPGPREHSLILQYRDLPGLVYGLAWGWEHSQVRELLVDELDMFLPRAIHEHVSSTLRPWWDPTPTSGHFTNAFLRPIPVAPGQERVVYALVCSGDQTTVDAELAAFRPDPAAYEPLYREARAKRAHPGGNPDGERYNHSQERMAATTLTNLVYPLYVRGRYVRHYTPGRWWNCLYSWDAGFVGLGLLQLEPDRAFDSLRGYLTEPGDPHAAFVHHGSPVPTQHYLFQELWNRTQDREMLEYAYPRLKQYHEFLAGRLGSSTTRNLASNLIRTWDYFYNSGGWDDYAPQVHVHREGLTRTVAPSSNTCHAIRTAKILRQAALALGHEEDLAAYDDDIATFTAALQDHAWDPEAGYFSYVTHDDAGRPIGILRDETGGNFNRGLDGVYPLVAGICTPEQEAALLAHLADPRELWTPIGLTAVDQSAPYYRLEGYWNGAVWMPHQWFMWRACLDVGANELAWRIAHTALELWKREVDASYNCHEHFIVATGRGAGWHQFTSLSSPVLDWYRAYFRPGALTLGLDGWVNDLTDNGDSLEADITLDGQPGRSATAVVCLAPNREARATWNGEAVPLQRVTEGAYHITLPAQDRGRLRVTSA